MNFTTKEGMALLRIVNTARAFEGSRKAEDLGYLEEAVNAYNPYDYSEAESDETKVLRQAWELSTWAACINWHGGENQKEWLIELREKIESFQDAYAAAGFKLKGTVATPPKIGGEA